MNTPRDSYFEENFEQALEAFANIELKAILDDASQLGYTSIAQALNTAARKAEDEGRQPRGKLLRLLDKACWMRLSPSKRNEPFDDPDVVGRWRSPIPNDFADSQIEFFAEIMESIDSPLLKGRLAELVWHCKQPREAKFALAAIDSYMQLPLDADTWFSDGALCWQRAISLSRIIKGLDRLDQIESSIVAALESATTQGGFYGHHLADTLMSSGLAISHSVTVAEKLEMLAGEFDVAANFYASGRYYNASAKWFKRSNNDDRSIDMTVAEAVAFMKKADASVTSDNPSYSVAAGHSEKAVQVYRSVPRIHRERHHVDEKIKELQLLINDYGQRALEEMKTISTPGVDVTEIVEQACEFVRGKPVVEAFRAFSNLHSINVRELRESARENLARFVVQGLFPKVFFSHDGRVIDRTHGFSGSAPSEENEVEIRAQMNQFEYGIGVRIAVEAKILPALDVLTLEHRLSEVDFINLAGRSPIVPIGREVLFGKALAQGFNRDFMTSIHLLPPQIEHMVRVHLESAGEITTHLSQEGIETEKGLSSLMDNPKTAEIFGENLAYEIEAIFCDQIGPNLRNNIAHGLLNDQQCVTIYSIYAWWLGLKLVFNPFWNSLRVDSVNEKEYQNDGSEPDQA